MRIFWADDVHVGDIIVAVDEPALGVEAQASHHDGFAVDVLVAAFVLHHSYDVAVAALVNPANAADLVLQGQHRQLDSQVIAVQFFAT